MKNTKRKISVVIIAKNEEDTILTCLQKLANGNITIDEVVVVVNNSSDATMHLATEYREKLKPDLKLINEPFLENGITAARIIGIKNTTGDIILCIDGDTIPSYNWAKIMSETLLSKNNILVGSYVKTTGTWLSKISNFFNKSKFSTVGGKAAQWIWGPSFGFQLKDKALVIDFLKSSIVKTKELGLSRNPDDYFLSVMMSKIGRIEVTNKTHVTQKVKEINSYTFLLRTIENVRNVKKINRALKC